MKGKLATKKDGPLQLEQADCVSLQLKRYRAAPKWGRFVLLLALERANSVMARTMVREKC